MAAWEEFTGEHDPAPPKVKPVGPLNTEADVRRAVRFTPAETERNRAWETGPEVRRMLDQAIASERTPATRAVLEAERRNLGPVFEEFTGELDPVPAAPAAKAQPAATPP